MAFLNLSLSENYFSPAQNLALFAYQRHEIDTAGQPIPLYHKLSIPLLNKAFHFAALQIEKMQFHCAVGIYERRISSRVWISRDKSRWAVNFSGSIQQFQVNPRRCGGASSW